MRILLKLLTFLNFVFQFEAASRLYPCVRIDVDDIETNNDDEYQDSHTMLCRDGWKFSNATLHCYYLSPDVYDADGATKFCEANGALLTGITSKEELDFIAALVGNSLWAPWLATRRNDSNGNWYNQDGTCHHLLQPYNASFWISGEPSTGNCALLRPLQPAGMRSTQCHNLQPALCKQHAGICDGAGVFGADNQTYNGTITSPGWPFQYYNGLCCSYKIIAPPGQKIVLHVEPAMMGCGDLDIWDEFDCFDGPDVTSLYMDATISWPKTFYSTGSVMYCIFFSNSKGTNRGWAAKWTAVPIPGPIIQGGCSGVMTSPNWPNSYLPMTLQEYYINADSNYRINMTFIYFASDYMFDYLEIFNGDNLKAPKLANYSGSVGLPLILTSSGSNIAMRLTSYTRTYQSIMGFRMFWYCIPL